MLGEAGEDRLTDASRAAGLVDDDDAPDLGGVAGDSSTGSGASQRRSSDPTLDAFGGQPLGDPHRQVEAVGPRHDEHIAALAGDGRRTDRRTGGPPTPPGRHRRGPAVVADVVQIAGE